MEQPERQELRLSDAFQKPVDDPSLELKVTMLNINHGKNCALMEQCKDLNDYAVYVAKVREYAMKYDIKVAVEYAITECIQQGILAEFLTGNRAEAMALSIFEYDEEKEMKLIRADERRIGEEKGRQNGLREGEKRGEALNLAKVIKKMVPKSTPAEIADFLELSEEIVKEVTTTLKENPQTDIQAVAKIILK
jgi:hypothetical protein